MTIFLGLVPLNASEKRRGRRYTRLFFYGYELVTVGAMLLAGSYWFVVLAASMALLSALLVWQRAARKGVVQSGASISTPERRSAAMLEVSRRFPRIAALMALSGAGFTMAGQYNGNAYWLAAFSFTCSLGFLIWWRVLRRR